MNGKFSYLTEPLPVLLDPVARFAPAGLPLRAALPLREGSRVLMTYGGTGALYQAARALKLGSGSGVLLPAYNCGHEIEPFIRAGCRASFYRVDRDLSIDTSDLASRIDEQTRAVLVTHYFGFPQPLTEIRALCDERGIRLIEDCAHALFSGRADEPLGLTGDLAVFSIRKSLPIPYGGALVCHSPELSLPDALVPPPSLSVAAKRIEKRQKAWLMPQTGVVGTYRRAAFLAMHAVGAVLRGACAIASKVGSVQFDPDDESLSFPRVVLQWGIAPGVEREIGRFDPGLVAERRRACYVQLAAGASQFRGARAMLPELPAGVCPLVFPLIASDTGAVVRRLRRAAISAVQWWGTDHETVPWSEFPDASWLKEHVVALPVHQDLTPAHVARMIEVLSKAE